MLPPDECHNPQSGLLLLPTEIRCHIYGYLLADSQAITIGAAYVTIFGHRIQDRARKDIPGLPLDLTPVIRCNRDDSLLSFQHPPTIAIDDAPLEKIDTGPLAYPAPLALLQTCHLIHDELNDYKNMRSTKKPAQAPLPTKWIQLNKPNEAEEGLSLYLSYPYGLVVLKSMYPFLLKQARNVHISGYYTEPPAPTPPAVDDETIVDYFAPSLDIARSFGTPYPSVQFLREGARPTSPALSTTAPRTRLRLRLPTAASRYNSAPSPFIYPPYPSSTADHAPHALRCLFRTLFSPEATQPVKVSARILYPGENTYRHVFCSEDSPIVNMLPSICKGDIAMLVLRADACTAICFEASAKAEGRCVSTSWENWNVGRGRRRERERAMDEFLRGV
ncbi:hypothetical protein IAQ61_002052 [Plenodomus lingam]|uniref:uncharacterized protein n=1 Tax=Leptosphaeria maculans TaxID=5022 RepID=UPI003316B326|nr:hypothetical protein IAQ61_002052 [Plenodomus lingam]